MFWGTIVGQGFAFLFGCQLIGTLVSFGILKPNIVKLSGKVNYEENFYKKLRDSKEM